VRADALILGSQVKAPETPLERARQRMMPFGRNRGRRLDCIEPSYLRWVLNKADYASLELKEAIKLVLSAGDRS
jgi:uncharacterized protein (DUF3820 family)